MVFFLDKNQSVTVSIYEADNTRLLSAFIVFSKKTDD